VSWLRWTGLFRTSYRHYRGRDERKNVPHDVEVLMGAALFMPRTVFRACGPWDERFTFGGEDVALCADVARRYRVVYHPEISITHLGRMSSRQNLGHAHTHTQIGLARQLRRSGASTVALLAYKLALTLDLPIQVGQQAIRYLARRLRGRPERARKNQAALGALAHFVRRGLWSFWCA
jgi:GT2 family glycosyltransferase